MQICGCNSSGCSEWDSLYSCGCNTAVIVVDRDHCSIVVVTQRKCVFSFGGEMCMEKRYLENEETIDTAPNDGPFRRMSL